MSLRDATDLFSEWADKGKDRGMEKGHAHSVHEMLKIADLPRKSNFTAIDVGCGNGWVCRLIGEDDFCSRIVGVDGSQKMVEKAKSLDADGEYYVAKLPHWKPDTAFDLIHSMEFLYYLEEPEKMLKIFHDIWLKSGGMAVIGIDHYLENEDSLEWAEALNVHMSTRSEKQWEKAMLDAGFVDVSLHRVGVKDGFVGTLAMVGHKS